MRTSLFLSLALVAVVLAACGRETAPPDQGATQATPPTEMTTPDSVSLEPVEARLEDGVQVVEIEAGREGYQPASVTLRAGVPARLVFTRTVESDCNRQIRVPDFGIEATDLPLGEPVAVEFTPGEAGSFTFVCGMDMQRGTLVVQS